MRKITSAKARRLRHALAIVNMEFQPRIKMQVAAMAGVRIHQAAVCIMQNRENWLQRAAQRYLQDIGEPMRRRARGLNEGCGYIWIRGVRPADRPPVRPPSGGSGVSR